MWLVTVRLRACLLLSQVQVDSCDREWRVKLSFIYISFHLMYLGVMVLCWGQCYKLRFNLAKPDTLPGPTELGLSAWKWKKWKYQSLSCVQLFETAWTVAHQALLSVGLSRQEYWSGRLFTSPGHLPDPEIEPGSPALQVDSLLSEPPEKPLV